MNAPDVRPARSDAEAHEAYALALSIFGETAAMDAYRDYKTALWFDDPAYAPENVIVARSGGAICGVSRIVPRTLYRRGQAYAMAGISSVCVAPALRGRGLSRTLIEHTLERCRARGFDFAFLVARRAADHYYTRFGFRGIASYSRVVVRVPAAAASPALVLENPTRPTSRCTAPRTTRATRTRSGASSAAPRTGTS
jgi:predicted N-acetyltransferase YhbS